MSVNFDAANCGNVAPSTFSISQWLQIAAANGMGVELLAAVLYVGMCNYGVLSKTKTDVAARSSAAHKVALLTCRVLLWKLAMLGTLVPPPGAPVGDGIERSRAEARDRDQDRGED